MISNWVTSIRGPPIDIIVVMSVFLIWYCSLKKNNNYVLKLRSKVHNLVVVVWMMMMKDAK